MKKQEMDSGTIAALMARLQGERIPRAKRMLEKVNNGETISDNDLVFLKRAYEDSRNSQTLVVRNPEYSELISRYNDLYTEIIRKALQNERTR